MLINLEDKFLHEVLRHIDLNNVYRIELEESLRQISLYWCIPITVGYQFKEYKSSDAYKVKHEPYKINTEDIVKKVNTLKDALMETHIELKRLDRVLVASDFLEKDVLSLKQGMLAIYYDLAEKTFKNIPEIYTEAAALEVLNQLRPLLLLLLSGIKFKENIFLDLFCVVARNPDQLEDLRTELQELTGHAWWRIAPGSNILLANNARLVHHMLSNAYDNLIMVFNS